MFEAILCREWLQANSHGHRDNVQTQMAKHRNYVLMNGVRGNYIDNGIRLKSISVHCENFTFVKGEDLF